MTEDQVIDLAVAHKLGRAMNPIGMQTGAVFATDQGYRTGELFAFAEALTDAERMAERVRCAEYLMQQAGLCPQDSACRAVLESAAGVVRLYGPAAALESAEHMQEDYSARGHLFDAPGSDVHDGLGRP